MILSSLKNYFKLISFRRLFLDNCLELYSKEFEDKRVLEIGANPYNRRGNWRPPETCRKWTVSNIDSEIDGVDLKIELPKIDDNIGNFDVVLCTEVMEYVMHFNASIKSVYNVLDKNGVFIWSVPFLHPQHGDYESDFWRYTYSNVLSTGLEYFSKVDIKPMGGPFAVVHDLLLIAGRKRAWVRVLLFPIFLLASFEKSDPRLCTGYFVICKK